MTHISMRTDQKPFSDVRVRQAMSLAHRPPGHPRRRPPRAWASSTRRCRRRSRTGRCPSTSSARAPSTTSTIPREAKRLLAEAGYPNGFPATICFTTYGSTILVDAAQLILKYLKDVGIDAKLEPEGVRRLHLDLLLRQVRLDDLRAPDTLPRARQLPLRPVHPRRAEEPEPRQRPRAWPTCWSASGAPRTSPSGARCIHEIQRHLRQAAVLRVRCPPASTSPCGTARSRTTARTSATTRAGALTAAWLDR